MAKKTTKKKASTAKTKSAKPAKAAKPASSKKKATKKKAAAKKPTTKKAASKKVTKKKAIAQSSQSKSQTKSQTASQAATKTVKKVTKKKVRPVIRTRPAVKLSYAAQHMAEEAAAKSAMSDAEPLTEAQLRKKKSGLSKKQMAFLKQELLERRAEILGDIESLGADAHGSSGGLSNMPLHMADVGTDNYDREFTLGLMESERKILIQIDEALVRMQDGYYGVCLETGEPIGFARLEFKPWAKYTIEVARERERKGLQ